MILRQTISNDVAFKHLMTVISRETSKREGNPQTGSARKGTVGVGVPFTFKYFNIKRAGPRCQSSVFYRNLDSFQNIMYPFPFALAVINYYKVY